jgi:hypothetical protein
LFLCRTTCPNTRINPRTNPKLQTLMMIHLNPAQS